jgi:class 3 adenylate cyclase
VDLLLALLAGAVVAGIGGYVAGARRSPLSTSGPVGRRLEEYDFYPFTVTGTGHVEFNADAFDEAVRHFLVDRNEAAARELIVIGEQNLVRDTLPSDRLARYRRLYDGYDGDGVVSDNAAFLENYRRIVNQLGRSFRNTGIEILLHDLVNPSRSLVAIENGEVTGRTVGSGATNLVLDLKTRRQRGEDKVNYELNIGARQFKCTTVPIFRSEYGLVGAVCINVDTHFIREAAGDVERLEALFSNLLRTDFELDENILSPEEYQNALNGKRHFLDDAIRTRGGKEERHLAAIFFSDIVGFTALMAEDEAATLAIVDRNEDIHRRALAAHRGRLLKRMGDGVLAAFDSVSDAAACAREVRAAVDADGGFTIRIGIHLGEVVEAGGDVHGDGVNVAARIQSEMEAGQIGVSDVVYDNIRNKGEFALTRIGERTLKNITGPMVLYTLDR